MTTPKKTPSANLDSRRLEMFLIALVLVLSCVYCALEWKFSFLAADDIPSIDDIIDDIDFAQLQKDYDLIAAVPEIDIPENVATVIAASDIPQVDDLASVEPSSSSAEPSEPLPAIEPSEPLIVTPINNHEALLVVERMPEFPGGASAFIKWLTAAIHYPSTARDHKIEGKIIVSFIVDAQGNTTDLAVVEASDQLLAAAVLTAMRKMPQWTPGIQNGKPCSTMIRVPINFNL